MEPEFHYRVHKIPPLVHILRQMNPVHTFPTHFPNMHSNIIFHLCPGLPNGLFLSGFPTKILYTFLISPMRATHLAPHILLDFITLIIYNERYNLWRSSLCSLLQPPITSSLLGRNILISTLFSNIINPCSSTCLYCLTKTLNHIS